MVQLYLNELGARGVLFDMARTTGRPPPPPAVAARPLRAHSPLQREMEMIEAYRQQFAAEAQSVHTDSTHSHSASRLFVVAATAALIAAAAALTTTAPASGLCVIDSRVLRFCLFC